MITIFILIWILSFFFLFFLNFSENLKNMILIVKKKVLNWFNRNYTSNLGQLIGLIGLMEIYFVEFVFSRILSFRYISLKYFNYVASERKSHTNSNI